MTLKSLAGLALALSALLASPSAMALTIEQVNGAQWADLGSGSTGKTDQSKQTTPENSARGDEPAADAAKTPKDQPNPAVLKAQVMLDRMHFSPGVIDGFPGENLTKAVRAFQKHSSMTDNGTLDEKTWVFLLSSSTESVVMNYTIAPDDLRGPFSPDIPADFEAKASLKHLGYSGPKEALAEKFHMDEDLLDALNPNASFDQEGTTIIVAKVGDGVVNPATGQVIASNGADDSTATAPDAMNSDASAVNPPQTGEQDQHEKVQDAKDAPSPRAEKIVIDKRALTLRVYDKDQKLLAFYPASIGSEEKPAPSGHYSVRAVAKNPTYRYNPKYAFKGVKAKESFEIAAGPNNPVGAVWIDLTLPSYGIHGTPDPSKVSKTFSHGCVRLTNWDALALAKMVHKGTSVDFVD